MFLTDIISGNRPSLSFEVFPPKTDDAYTRVETAVQQIAQMRPSYMSVTYGAGGGTSLYSAKLAGSVLKDGVTPLAHLTCISATREKIRSYLTELKSLGVENILALRGDLPAGMDASDLTYHYAYELIDEIRDFGGFCVGGACYPECHPESENSAKDMEYLRIKAEHGCQFLTTQMFFDNAILYNFLYRLLHAGVDIPVVAGIMPVTNAASIKRICSISGTSLPQKFLRIVDRYGHDPAAMTQAGIAYATEQVIDLFANGINAVHIYSMNKPEVAAAIRANLSSIIR